MSEASPKDPSRWRRAGGRDADVASLQPPTIPYPGGYSEESLRFDAARERRNVSMKKSSAREPRGP